MKKNLFFGATTLLAIVAIIISVLALKGQKKIAYFDYAEVHEDCDLKERLQKDLEMVVSKRTSELDSIKLELTFLSNKVQANIADQEELDLFEDTKNRFLTLQNSYEQENYRLKEDYFNQIRKSINDKAKSFGEDNGYDYLFSAAGDGALMYASESEDVTKLVLEYVNK
ncbi:MAG: OmpH family outer membrane protein [Crocinitomicaceae bacterium]|nr:OmpH family outer membrane protein [Flavobacteriales bacterium]NQZ38356.1 OmpH family outer membrane protein [Crocinitomicaceae bacterium]